MRENSLDLVKEIKSHDIDRFRRSAKILKGFKRRTRRNR